MSSALTLTLRSPVAGVLVGGLTLAAAAACHHRSPAPVDTSAAGQVPVGYGVQSRERTGGAVQSATFESPKDVKVTRVEELLVGRFPGVRVHRTPGGGFSVRIRGTSTGEPLWVVDGMPVEVTPGRGLDWLSPADVARIDLLKNATEMTMYGARGANGVILITTKRRR